MDQSFSRYAIASIVLAILVPVEFYINDRGISKNLPVIPVLVTMIANLLVQ